MTDIESQIKDVLGEGCVPFSYHAAGVGRAGWKVYVREDSPVRPRRLVARSWRRMHELDVRLFVGAGMFEIRPGHYVDKIEHRDGMTAHDMPPGVTQVFALPGLPTLDIIEFARVGSHNAPHHRFDFSSLIERIVKREPESAERLARMMETEGARFSGRRRGEESWRDVQAALSPAMAECPFAIPFADEAGLHATFPSPITVAQATHVVNAINGITCESLGAMLDNAGQMGFTGELPAIETTEAIAEIVLATQQFRLWWD